MASKTSTTREQAATYVVVKPLLKALYNEFKELAKKKPDAAVSKMKIKIVNRLLERCQMVLATEPELEFLELLDAEGAIAQASDAVLMIGQFVSAMDTFRSHYCRSFNRSYDHYWYIENGERLNKDGTELSGVVRNAGDDDEEGGDENEGDDENEGEVDDDEDDK